MDYQDNEIKRFIWSFIYAFRGIGQSIKAERNLKIHLFITVFVILASLFFELQVFEWIAVLLCIGSVLSLEMMNTALESVVDLTTNQQYNIFAKIAKDAAAGSVLISVIISVIIGLIIFLPKVIQLIWK